MRFAVLSVYLQPYLSIRTMRTFILFLLAAVTFFSCGQQTGQKGGEYPRTCTEEDLDLSVRDKYQAQAENFLQNFYLLLLEVTDKEMAEDFIKNLFVEADRQNYTPEFMQDGKGYILSPSQYLMEYDKLLALHNRDEMEFIVDRFSHDKDMYMASARSCYTVTDYDLTLRQGDDVIFKGRCRAWCCFPKASSYLTVRLMQVKGLENVNPLEQESPTGTEPQAVAVTDSVAMESAENDSLFIDSDNSAKIDSVIKKMKEPKEGSVYEFLLRFKDKDRKETEPKDSARTASATAPNTVNGHEYVDLGLSVKWATCNVGASSPEEPGDYFAWGEITPKERYTKKNCIYFNEDIGDISNKTGHDAATAIWGKGWRMPTKKELQELKNKCRWQHEVRNGQAGFKITGPNGNSIFLPAAGNKASRVVEMNRSGYYWSGNSDKMDGGQWKGDTYYRGNFGYDYQYGAYGLTFTVEGFSSVGCGKRSGGESVRPVTP